MQGLPCKIHIFCVQVGSGLLDPGHLLACAKIQAPEPRTGANCGGALKKVYFPAEIVKKSTSSFLFHLNLDC